METGLTGQIGITVPRNVVEATKPRLGHAPTPHQNMEEIIAVTAI